MPASSCPSRLELLAAYADGRRRDVAARNAIAEAFDELVQVVARSVARRLPRWVELDDLLSDGQIGLLDAIDRFEADRGVAFATYASRRIAGQIHDGIRNRDHLSRSMRQAGGAELQSIHCEIPVGADGDTSPLADLIHTDPRRERLSPAVSADTGDLADLLDAMAVHDRRERLLLTLYYGPGLVMREIAETIGVSESRVSQLHTHLMARLRASLLSQLETRRSQFSPGEHP